MGQGIVVLRVSIRFVMLTRKVRGFETAHCLFFANIPRANSSEEMRVEKEQVVHPREKKGGSEGGSEGGSGNESSQKWNGYEKWFGSFEEKGRLKG